MKRHPSERTRKRRRRSIGIEMPRPAVYLCAGTIVIGLAAVDADNNILLLMFGIYLGAIVLSCLTA